MKALIEQYLESHRLAWAASTLRSEANRLMRLEAELGRMSPLELWEHLSHTQSPYTRTTTWTRVVDFIDWCLSRGLLPTGANKYKVFREENARLFKNVYEKSIPDVTYEEALKRIQGITDEVIRTQALRLLTGGLRYTESQTLENGHVVGKGGKRRRVYAQGPEGRLDICYSTFVKKLKAATGLKPHDLRKIFLNELVNKGGTEFDLVEIAGWSSISTASSYIKANSNRARSLIDRIHGGIQSETESIPRKIQQAS